MMVFSVLRDGGTGDTRREALCWPAGPPAGAGLQVAAVAGPVGGDRLPSGIQGRRDRQEPVGGESDAVAFLADSASAAGGLDDGSQAIQQLHRNLVPAP